MSTIVTRSGKGSPLSHVEVDANFTNLNTDKIQSGNTVAALTITSATVTDLAVTGITSFDGAQGTAGQVLTSSGTGNTPTWATVSGSISVTGGDLTLSGNTGTAITNATLATVNSNTGAFGSTTSIPVITVNGKGLITAVSTAAVAGGAALSNDTTTASNLYPLFAAATTGTPTTIYTSNANYLYKPSTGELQANQVVASNGIFVNATTSVASYTIASGTNGLTVGPYTVSSGQSITVTSGQRWVVL